MSLEPERTPMGYSVFGWLEIAARLEDLGDGALASNIFTAMNGHRLRDDATFDLTDDEGARVQAVLAE
ncbi:MAG: hypothetical protein M3R02_29360 [Chloroflexota bacterium]|nr:hypothetical protein [Chloroflexota bacterium]